MYERQQMLSQKSLNRHFIFAFQMGIATWHFKLACQIGIQLSKSNLISNMHSHIAFQIRTSNIAFQIGMKMHFKIVYYGILSWRFHFAFQISIPIWQSTLAFQSGGSTWHLKVALPISIAKWHFNSALPKTAQDIQGDSKAQKSMFQDIFKHSRWLKTAKRISLQQL